MGWKRRISVTLQQYPQRVLFIIKIIVKIFHISFVGRMNDLIDGRCGWCGTDTLYIDYHDREWGTSCA